MKTTTQLTSLALLSALSCSVASAALTTTTTFDGSGALTEVNNWNSGLPTNANPGLVSTGGGWLGTAWADVAVLQTGGEIFAAGGGDFAMRGGAEASGNTTILEIDDASNTSFATTNLAISGELTMWSQFTGGGGHQLSLLNGYADVSSLNASTNASLSTINIGNGKLDIGSLTAAKVTVNMLSSGTGELVLADQGGGLLNSLRLNFASDSSASFTILGNGSGNADGYWGFYVNQGYASIDGDTNADLSQYLIVNDGVSGTTISVIPEPSSAGLLFGMVSFAWLALRRR